MNILYLCDEYPPSANGGIGSSVRVLAEEMAKKGNNIFVCGLYPSFRTIEKQFTVQNKVTILKMGYFPIQSKLLSKSIINKIFSKYLKFRFFQYTKLLKKIIKENEIQIIEIPDYQEIFFDSFKQDLYYDFEIPIVIKTHGSYSYIKKLSGNPLNETLFKKEVKLYKSASAVICLSNFSKKITEELYGESIKAKIEVIPHGVSIPLQVLKEKTVRDTINVIFVGSLTKTKGIFELIKAWNLVCESTVHKMQLNLFGKYSDDVYNELNLLLDKNHKKSVIFHGHVDRENVYNGYINADFAVLPSYFETFGMVAIEAMSCNCPVLFTDKGSGKEIIIDGENGFLISPDRIEEMADKISLLINDQSLRKYLACNAMKTVKEFYQISAVADRHISLYKGLMSK